MTPAEITAQLQAALAHHTAGRWSDAEVYTDEADALLELNRPNEAVDLLRAAQQLRPDDLKFGANLALALSRAGRGEEAIAFFRDLAARDPGSGEAWMHLSEALWREQ